MRGSRNAVPHWRKPSDMSFITAFSKKVFHLFHKSETVKIKGLEDKIKTMQQDNESLAKEVSENREKIRNFDLVSDALKAEPVKNSFIDEFASLIDNDYSKELCNHVPGVNDAENLKIMQQILEEMKLIANCPNLHSKGIGAVGGGFSSGKSSFINSFFVGSEVKLAEGIKPVTAIPSYVICDQDSAIHGISFRGGLFPITIDMYKEISHEFLKSFSFDLKEIVTYTTVLTPMEEKYFKNLCLIDTPGYNPPDSGNTAHDFETARKYIKDAAFLIWIVGLDTNGTVPKSDIDFLSNLEFGANQNKPLYIVANKAQLKTKDDIENILDKFEETLDDFDISYAGISAYNSMKKELHASRKSDIYEFLAGHNKPSTKYADLKGMLHDVFKQYVGKVHEDDEEKNTKRKEVKTLLLNALESGNIGLDDTSSKLEEGLNKLLRYFQSKEDLDKRIQRVTVTRDKFMACLDNFCDAMGIERKEERFCTSCGEPIEGNKALCKKCSASETRTNEARICPGCGKKAAKKDIFCVECGERLD